MRTSEALRSTRRGLAEEELALIIKEVGLKRGEWLECEVTGDITPGLWKSISDALERNGRARLPTCPSETKESLSLLIVPHLRPDEVIQDWIDPKSTREWPCGESDIRRIRKALAGAGGSFSEQDIREAIFGARHLTPQEEAEYAGAEALVDELWDSEAEEDSEVVEAAGGRGRHFSDPEYNKNLAESMARMAAFRELVAERGTTIVKSEDRLRGASAKDWLNDIRRRHRDGRLRADVANELESLPDWTWDSREARLLSVALELEEAMTGDPSSAKSSRPLARLRNDARRSRLPPTVIARLEKHAWWPEQKPAPHQDIEALILNLQKHVELTPIETEIVQERILRGPGARRVHLDALGQKFSVSREAVRQTESRVIARALHPSMIYRLVAAPQNETEPSTHENPGEPLPGVRENQFVAWMRENYRDDEDSRPGLAPDSNSTTSALEPADSGAPTADVERSELLFRLRGSGLSGESLLAAAAGELGWRYPLSKGRRKQIDRALMLLSSAG